MATAVITGASSGIGKEMAIVLSRMGYDIILVARRGDKLQEVSKELQKPAEIMTIDLSKEENCYSLYERCKGKDVEIIVNNAGFGNFGNFSETELSRDMEMLDLYVKALHILTKLFLLEFKEKNRGKILNVASAAGFMPQGPMLSTYYATKAYVLSLTRAIAKELKKENSGVTVSALCPGPVKTEFDQVAGVDFQGVGMSAKKCAEIGISGLLRGKNVIIPGILMKVGKFFTKILPDCVIGEFAYHFQRAKRKD
ncbi:MAG: SDR family oxidoreductase [Clostridia bacterium]|nr:SDR family oxidoreductase [Clostridia bacterium]